ncbi:MULTISPECIES: hypothetical protein [Rhodococcus]|uniref:hypothetical protein n=1 Tax=Rhodococcus TaxID=1827 RepID=UPI0007AE3C26|nr:MULTISPECIES: hypothetical protein [Rhodococcus]KZL33207.1 hypothetical protein A3852_12995 [Rhodococcus qingshengii]MCE4161633.1 hypothetical protein [Rhodococcus sp. Ni2]
MPAEKFYDSRTVEGDTNIPVVTIGWSRPGESADPGPHVNGVPFDRSGINRMIAALRRARDQVYGADE